MANPLALILVVGAAAVVLGKKKKKKSAPVPEEGGPMVVPEDEFEEEPEPEPEPTAPFVAKFQAVKATPKLKVMQIMLPIWSDEAAQRAKGIMSDEFAAKGKKIDGAVTFFRLAKKAANEIFPGQPWPQKVSDEDAIETSPGFFENKWIVDAGPMGPRLKGLWAKFIGVAYEVTGYRAP